MSVFDGVSALQPPYHHVTILDDATTTRARNTYRDGGTLKVTEMVACRCYREVQNTEITHYDFDEAHAALDRMRA